MAFHLHRTEPLGNTTVRYKIKFLALKYNSASHTPIAFPVCAGEDGEEMGHQEEGGARLSGLEGSGEGVPGSSRCEAARKSQGPPCPKRLFAFSLVNAYGTADVDSLVTDGKLLKLNRKHLLWLLSWPLGDLASA